MVEKVETVDELTTRLAGISSQRELGKELRTATDAKAPKPMIAAIEQRITARAQEVKESQRRSAATRPVKAAAATGKRAGKRAGKPAPQNSVPIAPGTFGQPDAQPLAHAYMDKAGEMDLKVAFGDGKSLIRNIEPIALTGGVHPQGGNLISAGDVELDTSGLPARVSIDYVYLLDGDKPIGRCELAAPLPLAPGERATFRAGTLLFKS